MRDLLNLFDLMESRGLAARKPGDLFQSEHSEKDQMFFRHIQFWPSEGGSFSQEELPQAVEQVENSFNKQIHWENNMPKTGGFGIITFDLPNGDTKLYGRYFQNIKPNHAENKWAAIQGYKLQTKSAKKVAAGLMPQDILTNENDLTGDDVVEQISAKFGFDHPLTSAAEQVNAGQPFPITIPAPEDLSFTAFRDYFCELLHPIALQRGTYEGDAAKAEEIFLTESSFAECSINYGGSKTEGLSDSIMVAPDNHTVKVSSKGKGGAEASVKNILNAVEEAKKSGTDLADKYEEVVEIVETVKKGGTKMAPISLAVRYGIISAGDAMTVNNLLELTKKQKVDFETPIKTGFLTDTLKELYEARGVRDESKVNPYFHLLAAIAHKVAEYINENTDFSKAASAILNNAALVQVYTKAHQSGDTWVIDSFDTVYPGETVTGVMFSASKGYYSTDIKGNFTFKILKNGMSEKAMADSAPEPGNTPAADRGEAVKDAKSDVKASKGKSSKLDLSKAGRKTR
jgi:hypothetical protein